MSHAYVPVQVFGVHEALIAMLTTKRILFRMFGYLMIFEVFFSVEAFVALAALVQRMVDMLGFVLLQLVLPRERHFAVIAFERPYVTVTRERVSF